MSIDWNNLGFSYSDTKSHIRYVWKDGKWDDGTLHTDPYMSMHVAATALHYGQAAFEGLKAFSRKDGSVGIFRMHDNARRMMGSANRVLMAEVPQEIFEEAILRVVKDNLEYVPPYGTNGALYIRPLLIGTGARLGLQPADEYTFLVLVAPVGDYYKGGLTPVSALVMDEYDRAAPHGTGHVKLSGNYAPTLLPGRDARERGFPIIL
jgi:branched-chain amino acid aminotransferase